jgi:hypothetical protein
LAFVKRGRCHRLFQVTQDLEGVVVNFDKVGGVTGQSRGFRDDCRHRIARHEHHSLHQRETPWNIPPGIGLGWHLYVRHIHPREHPPDSGRRNRRRGVDAGYASVSKRASHEHQVEGSGRREVIGKRGLTSDQRRIFGPLDGRAD